jgi:hypothetical protein
MITSEITYEWKRVIETCYRSDADLTEKYHILAPVTPEEAIKHTCGVFSKAADTNKFEMYECRWNGEFMGYYGLEILIIQNVGKIQVLTGFFVMPDYRTDEIKKAFLEHVKSKFPSGKILTYIFSKNKRARGFFARNGGEVIETITNLIDGVGEAEYKLIVC